MMKTKLKKKSTAKGLERGAYNKAGGMTHREIAVLMGISHQAVAQIEAAALKKLAHPAKAKILKQFLEG